MVGSTPRQFLLQNSFYFVTQLTMEIYFDGASKGNPGEAGSGWVLMDGKTCVAHGYNYVGPHHTNNEAEYDGIIRALEFMIENHPKEKITIKGDSKLVVMQVQGRWKCKAENLKPLMEEAKSLLKLLPRGTTVKHVPRGENSLADRISNLAVNTKNKNYVDNSSIMENAKVEDF